jgi:HK97 family phage major capsid protein
MPTSTTFISETNATSLMPAPLANEVITAATQRSIALQLMKRLPNMVSSTEKMPVLNALATAYFVNGTAAHDPDTAPNWKTPTAINWTDKTIYAEEIACFVPIAENTLNDSAYNIWGSVRESVLEAIGLQIDQKIFFSSKPNTWPSEILTAAAAAGNTVAFGTYADLADDVSAVMSMVEADGYMVSGFVAHPSMRGSLRELRDSVGHPLLAPSLVAGTPDMLHGVPIYYMQNGAFNTGTIKMFVGDFKSAVYSIRQDVTWKLFTEASIYDPSNGALLYALPQMDMVALRVVMRLGWQVPNPVNRLNTNSVTRYPFATLTP